MIRRKTAFWVCLITLFQGHLSNAQSETHEACQPLEFSGNVVVFDRPPTGAIRTPSAQHVLTPQDESSVQVIGVAPKSDGTAGFDPTGQRQVAAADLCASNPRAIYQGQDVNVWAQVTVTPETETGADAEGNGALGWVAVGKDSGISNTFILSPRN